MLCCLLLGDVAAHEAEEVLLGGHCGQWSAFISKRSLEISFPDASTCIFTWWPCIHSFKGLFFSAYKDKFKYMPLKNIIIQKKHDLK